jgi:hypothetical protein
MTSAFSNLSMIACHVTAHGSKGKGKGKAVPALNWAPRQEDVRREWMYISTHS